MNYATNSTALAALALLVACGERPVVDTPKASPDDFIRAVDVLVNAQCELNAAAARSGAAFSFDKAVFTMSLTVSTSETTGGGLKLTIPIAGTRVALERSRRPIGSAIRRMEFQALHDVTPALDCPTKARPKTAGGVNFIEGNLGLEEWLTETDAMVRGTKTTPSQLNYELAFDIALSTALNPIFSRDNGNGLSPDIESQASDDRRVRHRIVVTLAPDEGQARTAADRALMGRAGEFLDRLTTR